MSDILKGIEVGLKNRKTVTVKYEMTAASMGSGLLPVFATPYLVAMIEATCKDSVQPFLPSGYSTVGTKVDIEHCAPTMEGSEVNFESELVEVDRRRLVFNVTAYDAEGIVARGKHERFIVENDKFLSKANSRKKN